MSTPKWKKEARRKEQAAAKAKAQYDKLFGTPSKKKRKTSGFQELKEYSSSVYVRETPDYPSLSTTAQPSSCAKRESPQYTGDYITGIATMHKSNLVPVSKGVDPKDYSTMRRN